MMAERTSKRSAVWAGLAAGVTVAAVISGLVYLREHRSAEYAEPEPYPAAGPVLPTAVPAGPTETVSPAPPPSAPAARSFFPAAGWLWTPIGPDPALAPDSATWVGYLSDPAARRIADLYRYGVTLVPAAAVTPATPRYEVTLTEPWGGDPLGVSRVPIPAGTAVPPGSDGQIAVLDPTTNEAFGLWRAVFDPQANTWSASWGGVTPLDGDGIVRSGSATATKIARYAGVISAAEFSAAVDANTGLAHALVFSTDIAGPDFVAPAIKSDGTNTAAVAVPMPEGSRIQLDPAVNVDEIPGITPGEKVIAKTLQTHGAYAVDKGRARMAFVFEALPGADNADPGDAWEAAGLEWDEFELDSIPWPSLRVIAAG